jgi:hypothetical protein
VNGGMMAWWQQLVALCVSLTAVLVLLGLLGRWGHRMWSTSRKFNRLLDQMLGDKEAGLPSLMDQLGDIREEQDRQAAWQAEHARVHASTPNGRAVQQPQHRRRA